MEPNTEPSIQPHTDPSIFVIFGATGDLSRRKLLPALCRLDAQGDLPERFRVLAVGRRQIEIDAYLDFARQALVDARHEADEIDRFISRIDYFNNGDGTHEDYAGLKSMLARIGRDHDIPANHVFYLSLPPRVFESTVRGLGESGLNTSEGWTRLVVEKPFGRDLDSARDLNAKLHQYFGEDQVYRIDHYLGKETVQNLLVFRLSNAFIESLWNRERIESVQITVGEDLGVGTRGGYYDRSGALRDMVQNHMTQLLTLVASEVPTSFSASSIRYEKIKVLRSIRPLTNGDVIRGQYRGGEIGGKPVPGYTDEPGVPDDSQTETFVALKMYVDSWRWQGVPFFLRTGKCMPAKTTQIAVRFRSAPVSFFERIGCSQDTADVLTITLQPHEGFCFHLDIKRPGTPLCLERIPLSFSYEGHFDGGIPEAYQTLLLDIIHGDQTLFVHADEVEESWRVYAPLLKSPPPVHRYAAGTWGPAEADALAIPETALWQTVGPE